MSIIDTKDQVLKATAGKMHDVERAATKSLHRHRMLYLLEGIVLVVLGLIVLALPTLAMVGISYLIGWALLSTGIVRLANTLLTRDAPGFWWSLLSAILGFVVGLIMIVFPIGGDVLLTVLLVSFFTIEGAATIMFALEHRRQISDKWEWMLATGVFDLVIGLLVFIYLPNEKGWVIAGLLIGINMVVGGIALIVMALHARSAVAKSEIVPN